MTVEEGETVSFDATPKPGYQRTVASGCGGSLSDEVFTTAPVTEDCTVELTFEGDRYVVEFLEETADFTVVRPGLAYSCSLAQEEKQTSRLILGQVYLPPDTVAAPERGASLVVDEIPWLEHRNVPDYWFKGIASCSLTSVSDAAGNPYLFIAYDEVRQGTAAFRVLHTVTIPLESNGELTDQSAWHYRQPVLEPIPQDDGSFGEAAPIHERRPQVHVRAIDGAIHLAAMGFNPTPSPSIHWSPIRHAYFPDVESTLTGTFTYQHIGPAPGPDGGLADMRIWGLPVPGTLDAEVSNGRFEITTIHAAYNGSHPWIMRRSFDGTDYTEFYDGFHRKPRIGSRTDARILYEPDMNARQTWIVSTTALSPGTGQWLYQARSNADLPPDVLYEFAAPRWRESSRPLEDGSFESSNVANIAWDAVPRDDHFLIAFRDPENEPDAQGFILYMLDPDDRAPIEGRVLFCTPEYAQYDTTGLCGQSHPVIRVPLTGLTDYRENVTCEFGQYEQHYNPNVDPSYNLECNNLLKIELYKASETAPEQLLMMFPNEDFTLRFELVDLNE